MSPNVELKRTQLHTIKSKINSECYDLFVKLPDMYENQCSHHKYDVLYILNGQWDFGLMISVYGSALYDGLLPSMILVGIGWNGQQTDIEARDNGMRDFTISDEVSNYGPSKFLDVLESEIITFVETKFSTSGIRCLSGSSIAAWFGLFTMFHRPTLFNKYVLSSPTPWLSNGLIFYYESLFSQANKKLDVRLYLCYGELEDSGLIEKFIEVLKNRRYNKLQFTYEKIKRVGHAGNKPIGYTKGIIKVYETNKQQLV